MDNQNSPYVTLPITSLQAEAAALLVRERGGVAWWRVGEGKTRIVLAAFIEYVRQLNDVTSHLLVFARPEAFYDWQYEAEVMGCQERVELMSYAALSMQSRDAVIKDTIYRARISMVAADELYLFKNPASLRTEALNRIAQVKPTIGISGSIMTAKRLEDIYGQAFAINKHRRIAPTLTKFREEFLTGINEHGTVKHYPKRGSKAAIMERCTSFAHVHMPKKGNRQRIESLVHVDVTSQQREYFDELQDTLAINDVHLELSNAASLLVKIQQVANGWIKNNDGEITAVASNKVAACIAKCEELIAAGERVVVWCAFRHDLELLRSATIGKFNCLLMQGGERFDIDAWKTGDFPVVFATMASGSSINHFAQVQYGIYFSLSQKWLDLQQSSARHDRKSSLHDQIFYYYLLVRGSMDENILRGVRQAGSAESAILKLATALQAWLRGSEKGSGDNTEL